MQILKLMAEAATLHSEEGSRYPRARKIPQWKPTPESDPGAVPNLSLGSPLGSSDLAGRKTKRADTPLLRRLRDKLQDTPPASAGGPWSR